MLSAGFWHRTRAQRRTATSLHLRSSVATPRWFRFHWPRSFAITALTFLTVAHLLLQFGSDKPHHWPQASITVGTQVTFPKKIQWWTFVAWRIMEWSVANQVDNTTPTVSERGIPRYHAEPPAVPSWQGSKQRSTSESSARLAGQVGTWGQEQRQITSNCFFSPKRHQLLCKV